MRAITYSQLLCTVSGKEIFDKQRFIATVFDWDSLIVNFKNDTEKLFPSIYNKVNKILKKNMPLTS